MVHGSREGEEATGGIFIYKHIGDIQQITPQ